jgi:hypothetical protein
MDDPEEAKSFDIYDVGQFCYISAWTIDNEESIPMWREYATTTRGVRIKLLKDPFKTYNIDPFLTALSKSVKTSHVFSDTSKVLFSGDDLKNLKFFTPQFMSESILTKVEYTNDYNKIYPTMILNDLGKNDIKYDSIGKFKNYYWRYQSEYRYLFYAYPITFDYNAEQFNYDSVSFWKKLIAKEPVKKPFPYYDMKISDVAFDNMEITYSPIMSEGSKTIVKLLVEKYNPKAELCESSLFNKLR